MKTLESETNETATRDSVSRRQRRQSEKPVFDKKREEYQTEYEAQNDWGALDFHTQLHSWINIVGLQSSVATDKYLTSRQSLEKNQLFLQREIMDLNKTREKSFLTGLIDKELRRGLIGRFFTERIAERILFPEKFMQQQLDRVEADLTTLLDNLQATEAQTDSTLGILFEQVGLIVDDIYEAESEWALSGDIDRFINYAVDHSDRKADLFARYLRIFPKAKQEIYEKYDSFTSFLKHKEPTRRSRPEVPLSKEKVKAVKPKQETPTNCTTEPLFDWQEWYDAFPKYPLQPEQTLEEDRRTYFLATSLGTTPIPVSNLDEIAKVLKTQVTDPLTEATLRAMRWVVARREANPITISRQGRHISYRDINMQEIRTTNTGRLLFDDTAEELVFIAGEHQEILGRRKNS